MSRHFGIVLVALVLAGLFSGDRSIQAEKTKSGWEKGKLESFSELNSMISSSATTPLIVMDDDDTLTMMSCPGYHPGDSGSNTTLPQPPAPEVCQYLGGPAWYSWQSGLIKQPGVSQFQVARTETELIAVSNRLLSLNLMDYTEPTEIPTVLQSLVTNNKAILVVLTARGAGAISATERQFKNLHVGTGTKKKKAQNFLEFLAANAPRPSTTTTEPPASYAGPFQCGKLNRPVSYRNGVMYVAGQNKGDALICLAQKLKFEKTLKASGYVYFIDDTKSNVTDVYQALEALNKNGANIKGRALHYTRLQNHKNYLTTGEHALLYQRASYMRWINLRFALQLNLLKP